MLNLFFLLKYIKGWLTIGPGLTNSNFNLEAYSSYFEGNTGHLTGCTERIEALRPKSPQNLRQSNNLRNNAPVINKQSRINNNVHRAPNVNLRPI